MEETDEHILKVVIRTSNMKAEQLNAYCSYLSPKDLVAHMNSLIPLLEQANKKKRQCSSTNDDGELSNTQLHKFAVGKRVFFVLDGLYTKRQVRRMNLHDGEVIVNTCMDGRVSKRTNGSVILDILGTSLSVLVRIGDCPKYIHNRNNRKHYLSESTLTTMKESNNLQSDQKDGYEQIIQLIRESNRCTTNKSFIGLNQIHDSAKPIPCCQESRSKSSSKTVLVNSDSKAKKNFPKYDRARVGDTVILQLGALYSAVEKQELVSTDRNLLLTSVRGSVVAKTSFAAEVCIDSSNLRVSLSPINYQRGVDISEHHLNLNRDAERLKAALKLVRRSSFCVQPPIDHSASVSGATTQSDNAVVSSSDMASDSSYSSDDSDSEEEEEEEEEKAAEFNRGKVRSISDVNVPSVATFGADGQVIMLSDRRCKYTSRGCAQGVAPTRGHCNGKRKAGCADLQSPPRAAKLFSAPRHHASTDVIDRGASQNCHQRIQHQQLLRPHGDLRGYVLSAADGLRIIPQEEDDEKSSNLSVSKNKEFSSDDDDDDDDNKEEEEEEEEDESFIDYDYKERRRSSFAAAVRKEDRSNSSSDEDMPDLALLPKVTQYKQYNTTYWSGCK